MNLRDRMIRREFRGAREYSTVRPRATVTLERALWTAAVCLIPAAVLAQRPPRIVSPEVRADRTITFRLRGPELNRAVLRAAWAGDPKPMEKDENGIWSVTVGPVPPQIYSYSYEIDGVNVIDPHNPRVKLWEGGGTSVVEVRGDQPAAYDLTDHPHGDLHVHYFRSSIVNRQRRVFVYTPPGYRSGESSYPTLYLLHGSGDNESTWAEVGKANLILDNLIAAGKALPMVVVMTNGHPIPYGTRNRSNRGENSERYLQELMSDVMPLVESRYRLKQDRGARAIAGLSMGGGQSLHVGFSRPDVFAWVGAFSSAVFRIEENEAVQSFVADPDRANERTRLLWIAIGEDDSLIEGNNALHALLDQKGVEHTYKVTAGGHRWPVWRGYFEEFAALLFH